MTSDLLLLAGTLLDSERAPIEHRDAALALVSRCNAAGQAGAPVDVWRLMAWARGLAATLQAYPNGARILCVGASAPALVAALAGTTGHSVTLVHSVPKAGRRVQRALRELLAVEAELLLADPVTWSPEERTWDVGITFEIEPALAGCTSPGTTGNLASSCTVWLPRTITVRAVLVDHDTGARVDSGPAVVVSAAGIQTHTVELPPLDAWGDEVVLETSVQVHELHRLERFQSGLTMDCPLPSGPRAPLPGARLSFHWDAAARTLNFD